MYSNDDYLQLSALQHFIFCPRQCALIHIEQAWAENRLTAEGRIMHENADDGRIEKRKDCKIARGLLLYSREMGLSGKADVVEFNKNEVTGQWDPFPVEYKRGKPKSDNSDKIQLCAQAMCLEEMLHVQINEGALFYGLTKHRLGVVFSSILREETKRTAEQLHAFVKAGETPAPVYDSRCKACSLIDFCLPKIVGRGSPVQKYLHENIDAA